MPKKENIPYLILTSGKTDKLNPDQCYLITVQLRESCIKEPIKYQKEIASMCKEGHLLKWIKHGIIDPESTFNRFIQLESLWFLEELMKRALPGSEFIMKGIFDTEDFIR